MQVKVIRTHLDRDHIKRAKGEIYTTSSYNGKWLKDLGMVSEYIESPKIEKPKDQGKPKDVVPAKKRKNVKGK